VRAAQILSNVPPNNESMEALTCAAGKCVKAIMLEENGGGCALGRALGHVSNSLSFQRFGHQMIAQSAAGMMWSGDQGQKNGDYQIKWLADRIVKAPYWYAQLMLSQSHQPNVVGGEHQLCPGGSESDSSSAITWRGETSVDADGRTLSSSSSSSSSSSPHSSKCFTDWMAAVSDDGKTLVIRTENPNNASVAFKATVAGGPWAPTASMITLSGQSLDAMNDYDTPTAVAPKNSTASIGCKNTPPPFAMPFMDKMHHFTKTGSGQT
jgi:hypothetical protein